MGTTFSSLILSLYTFESQCIKLCLFHEFLIKNILHYFTFGHLVVDLRMSKFSKPIPRLTHLEQAPTLKIASDKKIPGGLIESLT